MVENPPIGLQPLWLHNEFRLRSIDRAIERFKLAQRPIPPEWIKERSDLSKWLMDWRLKKERERIFPNSRIARFMLKFWTYFIIHKLHKEYNDSKHQ